MSEMNRLILSRLLSSTSWNIYAVADFYENINIGFSYYVAVLMLSFCNNYVIYMNEDQLNFKLSQIILLTADVSVKSFGTYLYESGNNIVMYILE